jgi:hypothetical protein
MTAKTHKDGSDLSDANIAQAILAALSEQETPSELASFY